MNKTSIKPSVTEEKMSKNSGDENDSSDSESSKKSPVKKRSRSCDSGGTVSNESPLKKRARSSDSEGTESPKKTPLKKRARSSDSGESSPEKQMKMDVEKRFVALGLKLDTIIRQQKELKDELKLQRKEIKKLSEAQTKAKESTKNALSRVVEEVLTNRKEQRKHSNISIDLSERVLPEKPFDSCNDFVSFEKKLRDSEAYQSTVKELSSLPNKGPEDFIRKSWRAVLNDNVAAEYSWHGTEKKSSAKNLIYLSAIRSAFQIGFKNSTLALVDETTKNFFNYANDRLRKKQSYKPKANSTNQQNK